MAGRRRALPAIWLSVALSTELSGTPVAAQPEPLPPPAIDAPIPSSGDAKGDSDDDALGFETAASTEPASSPTASGPGGDAPTPDDVGFGTAPAFGAGPESDAVGFGTAPPTQAAGTPAADTAAPALRASATLRSINALRVETDQPSRIANLRQVLDLGVEVKQRLGDHLRLRAQAGLRSEADFAYLHDLSRYDIATLDSEAWLLRPNESFLSLSLASVEFAIGYQIVNLGLGEMLSVLDVVNPRDLRQPTPLELSSQHLPVLMSRLGLAFAKFRAEVLVLHEAAFNLLPPPLGEFSPFRRLLLDNPSVGEALAGHTLRNRHVPGRNLLSLDATQAYGRINASVGRLDFALLAGTTLDVLGLPSLPDPASFSNTVVDMPLQHPRYRWLGLGGSLTFGVFLLRWEAALQLARPFAVERTDTTLLRWSSVRRDALAGLLGLTFLPSTLTSAAIEIATTRVFANPGRDPTTQLELLFPIEAPQLAFRFDQRFFEERASIRLLFVLFGLQPVNGWTARAELAYAVSDRLETSIGYVMYQPTEVFGYLYGFDRHDRAFLNLRWEMGD